MKPRVKVKVQFGMATRPAPAPEPDRVPRVARLLALAHYIDERIRTGEIENLAAAAHELGLTRARVTQIANLALLAPNVQAAILVGGELSERSLRIRMAVATWSNPFP